MKMSSDPAMTKASVEPSKLARNCFPKFMSGVGCVIRFPEGRKVEENERAEMRKWVKYGAAA